MKKERAPLSRPGITRVLRQALLAPALALLACASRGETADPAAAQQQQQAGTHEHDAAAHAHQQHEPALPATAGPGFTVADVRFMQDMIGHHAQALVMAAMAPTHGAGSQLLKLAEKIDISQRDEIDMMRIWLEERGQAVPDGSHAHASMPGMLTEQQLARLDAARGREFERLFLTFMIQHHEGALTMVEALFASPGAAQDPDIFRFATDVDADQRDEIVVMYHMLEMLIANRGSDFR